MDKLYFPTSKEISSVTGSEDFVIQLRQDISTALDRYFLELMCLSVFTLYIVS